MSEVTGLSVIELQALLDDPMRRLCTLYKIITKGDEDDADGLVVQFRPNRAQRRLLARLHYRNIILKARQLGFTTLVAILWLDTALFSKDPIRCGIIAHEREAAESIFRDKVVFAYNNLPEDLRDQFPLSKKNATELVFAHNGASIRVATSMRSGTMHRLHVSELGKIAAKYPHKAREVVTGSLPTVPKTGITIIESTAEGQDGTFYDMTERARALSEQGVQLSPKDYRFHFFPWWDAIEYTLDDAESIIFTEADLAYFLDVESKISRPLSEGQRAWYVATRRADFADEAPLMWQEYPSTPTEAFQVSTEGCYYATQLALARKQGRVAKSLPIEAVGVNTFWDIGRSDLCAVWFHQRVGAENRFIDYYEAAGEDFNHFAKVLQDKGYIYRRHYLPHDAAHKRQGLTPDTNLSAEEMLQKLLPGHKFEIVPRVTSILTGIQSTRNVFASCSFDEAKCDKGIKRLTNYRKQWDKMRGCWKDEPLHDDNSNGSDGFRQFGQVADAGEKFGGAMPMASAAGGGRKPWRRAGGSAMTA